jgi:hypothetical protein
MICYYEVETFIDKLLFTYSYELFGPLKGLTASNPDAVGTQIGTPKSSSNFKTGLIAWHYCRFHIYDVLFVQREG